LEQIKRSLKEAEIYRSHGLLRESKEKFLELLKFIGKSQHFSKNQKLIEAVNSKVQAVEKSIAEFDDLPLAPELDQNVQDLIKKLFSFSKTKEAAAIEGAVALAKFGQYERALAEFQNLLTKGVMPGVTAKNIIRCHMALNAPDAAVVQFKNWISAHMISDSELRSVRGFLQVALQKEGVETELPELKEPTATFKQKKKEESLLLDISGITVRFEVGPLRGQAVDFDVDFQSANTISIIISVNQKELADVLTPGTRLPAMQCYSPITVFRSNGIVAGKATIKQGPRRGDFMVDIAIEAEQS